MSADLHLPAASPSAAGDDAVSVTPAAVRGSVDVQQPVIHHIIRQAALSVPGCVERAVGMGHVTRNMLPQADIVTDGPYLSAEIHIAVSWPSPVVEVARSVRDTVHQHVVDYLGATVTAIDVYVDSVAPGTSGQAAPVAKEKL